MTTPEERIHPLPALSNHRRDAKGMAATLKTLTGGMATYERVWQSFEGKYGNHFRSIFYKEVAK